MFLKGMVQDAVVHVAQKVKCVKARGEAIVSRAHAVGHPISRRLCKLAELNGTMKQKVVKNM